MVVFAIVGIYLAIIGGFTAFFLQWALILKVFRFLCVREKFFLNSFLNKI
jgi:hypothetical protein